MPPESRHVAVAIDRPWREVAAFVGDPANLPAWAEGLGTDIERRADGVLTARTPAGTVEVRFGPANPFGVADHEVLLPTGDVVRVPLRVLPLDDGAEVVLTVRRAAGMTGGDFDADEAAVRTDLARLKRLLESAAEPGRA